MTAITDIARKSLLDWQFRLELLAGRQPLSLPSEQEERSQLETWLQGLQEAEPADVSRVLWEAALGERESSWGHLYTLLDPHLRLIRKEMFRTIDCLPGEVQYNDIIKEIIRTWPGSITKTPSSVVWSLAMMQSHRGAVNAAIYPLAAAAAFYYQGVVIFDDVADGELQSICSAWPRGQVEHIAYSMAAALPMTALVRLDLAPAEKVRVIGEYAQAIWITNIGQYMDLETLGVVSFGEESAERIAQYKTGLGIAKLSRVAGHFLQLDPELIDLWERCTIAFATARQIASDVCDIWGKSFSPDLATGKCTLPIAYVLRQLDGAEADEFRLLRELCRYQRMRHADMRLFLERKGALAYVQSRLDTFRAEGMRLLDELAVSVEARQWILTWAGQANIFADIC